MARLTASSGLTWGDRLSVRPAKRPIHSAVGRWASDEYWMAIEIPFKGRKFSLGTLCLRVKVVTHVAVTR